MTLRVTASTGTFVASQSAGTKMVSAIASLSDYLPATVVAQPMALTMSGGATPVDLLVTEVLIRSTKNPEVVHRLYKGPAVQIDDVLGAFARSINRLGALTPQAFAPDHGLEIEVEYENGTTEYAATFLWDIANASHSEQTMRGQAYHNDAAIRRAFGNVDGNPGMASQVVGSGVFGQTSPEGGFKLGAPSHFVGP